MSLVINNGKGHDCSILFIFIHLNEAPLFTLLFIKKIVILIACDPITPKGNVINVMWLKFLFSFTCHSFPFDKKLSDKVWHKHAKSQLNDSASMIHNALVYFLYKLFFIVSLLHIIALITLLLLIILSWKFMTCM